MRNPIIIPIEDIGPFDVVRVKLKETGRNMTALVLKKMGVSNHPPQFLEVFQIKNIEFRPKYDKDSYPITSPSLKKEMGLGTNSDYEVGYNIIELRLEGVEGIKKIGTLKDAAPTIVINNNFYRVAKESEHYRLASNRVSAEPTKEDSLIKRKRASGLNQLPDFSPIQKSQEEIQREARVAAEELFKPKPTETIVSEPEVSAAEPVTSEAEETVAPLVRKGKQKVSRKIKHAFKNVVAEPAIADVAEPETAIEETPVKKPRKPRTVRVKEPEVTEVRNLTLDQLAGNGFSEYFRNIFSGGKKPGQASAPIHGKNGNKFFLLDGEKVVINNLTELTELVSRPDWVELASKGIDGIGPFLAGEIQKEVQEFSTKANDIPAPSDAAREETKDASWKSSKPGRRPSLDTLAQRGQLSEYTRWVFSGKQEIGTEPTPVLNKQQKPLLDENNQPVIVKNANDIFRMVAIIGGVENLPDNLHSFGKGATGQRAISEVNALIEMYHP